MTTNTLPVNYQPDYIIVGGGTAGCVIASCLSSYLPHKQVLLIEAGPSDFNDTKVLQLKEWLSLLGDPAYDYDYPTTEQPMGNSHIRHSRAKILGGCSSHNTLISFRPLKHDLQRWESAGVKGWDFATVQRCLDQIRCRVHPVHPRHRNQLVKDWVTTCSKALDIPVIDDFNKPIREQGGFAEGVGFFSVAYEPEEGTRSSASVAYLHPIFSGEEKRGNLLVLTEAWVSRVNLSAQASSQRAKKAESITLTLKSGKKLNLAAKHEIILCGGSIDTPKLLLHSGIGPAGQLSSLGIPVQHNLAGVGENLLDHPESIIIWELHEAMPPETTMHSDGGIFLDRTGTGAPDLMMHTYQIPFCVNTSRLGFEAPLHAFCMTPNIPRPKSVGRLYLSSKDPNVKPALDFRYFTDPEGYDAKTLVDGFRAARKVAEMEPFKRYLKREVAPGPECVTDEQLSKYGRRVAHTVYHPAGTAKMGDPRVDEMAVVDPELKLVGVEGIRIADASVFPSMVTVNPMLTVLAIGERAAEMIAETQGWRRELKPML
ncbi:choline dehydrogenase [Sphaerosporella brunnea]|uniref:Choline dehydrogenase n=1 Tax=Sphaerosporella brunnea TaxID=1250544 RepID=A0A5J5EYX9_9PEZI|nr:choline dehydrogenase [Sphaerosporella brunnea]